MNLQIVDDCKPVNTVPDEKRRLLRIWAELFPLVFDYPFAPLKIGIHLDLQAQFPELSASLIGSALRFHVSRLAYLRHMKEGAFRLDLFGNQTGTVSAGNAAGAKQFTKFIYKKRKQHRGGQAAMRDDLRRHDAISCAQPPP